MDVLFVFKLPCHFIDRNVSFTAFLSVAIFIFDALSLAIPVSGVPPNLEVF